MKSYSHVISKLFNSPLLITPARHAALCQLLESKLSGHYSDAGHPGLKALVKAEAPDLPDTPDDDDPADNEQDSSDVQQVAEETVIIPVHGVIVGHPEDIAASECGCDLEGLNRQIDAVENDPRIERVIYDFRSPGGSAVGVPETARKILYSRKETIGFFDSECGSGAAWLASQCGRLYGTPSGMFGSIGVYVLCLDNTKALKKSGTKINAISAGKFKLLGASWKEMTDDERGHLQMRVDKIYAEFKMAMGAQRPTDDSSYGNGLMFNGTEACELGFLDGTVESLDELLDMME